MIALYRIAFVPVRKPYRVGLSFTHNNGDFGAISARERSCAAPISKVESHKSDRCSYYTTGPFVPAQKDIRYRLNTALNLSPQKRKNLI